MERLRDVNASMGLMVEQVSPRLMTIGQVHRHAPSKKPALRLAQLRLAGELGIPFTTGILLGIGETAEERVETLESIAVMAQKYGNIQECIIQPHSAGGQESFGGDGFDLVLLPGIVAKARKVLPSDVVIQASTYQSCSP